MYGALMQQTQVPAQAVAAGYGVPQTTSAKPDRRRLIGVLLGVLVLLLTTFLVCYLVFHKTDEEKIYDLAETLEEGLNEGDFDKTIGCFQPSTQKEVHALMNAASGLLGSADLKDLWAIGQAEMAAKKKISVNVYSIEVNGDTAIADISIEDVFGESRSEMLLVKIKGKWYFSDSMNLFS